MGTTIANLHRVGWFCPEPDRWCDPNSEVWKFSADKAHEGLAALRQALLDSVTEKLNTQASYHRFGEGIEDGTDLHVLKAHLRKLSKLQDHRQEGLLVAASSGGLWPNSRVHEVNPDHPPVCHLCGAPWADEPHLCWRCPTINASTDEGITGSEYLVPLAEADLGKEKHFCFWVRGPPLKVVSFDT